MKMVEVAPVLNAKGLKEVTINKILGHMNFKNDELSKLSYELKEEIVSNGGRKVDSTVSDFVSVYTNPKGKDYLITEDNKEKIDKIIEKDIAKYYNSKNMKSDVSTNAESSKVYDGIWTGYSTIIYNGINGSEYEYYFYSNFDWNGVPNVYFTDYVALAWQINATPIGQYFKHYYQWGYSNAESNVYGATSVDVSSVYGTRWGYDLLGSGERQSGWGREKVRIPVSNANLTGVISAGYAHPYTNSVVKAALGSASISWDDSWAMKHTWRQTIMYTLVKTRILNSLVMNSFREF